jgi:hypothetical protein
LIPLRAGDALHVAMALDAEAATFVTDDSRQRPAATSHATVRRALTARGWLASLDESCAVLDSQPAPLTHTIGHE